MSAAPKFPETAWQQGRFDQRRGPRLVLFGRMYEDAAIESSVFKAGGRIRCIASAGCTAMDLAARHRVVAVDINPAQLAYARQRNDGGRAVRGLAEQVMATGRTMAPLVGWSERRVEQFLQLEEPAEQTSYWNQHLNTMRFRLSFDRLMSIAVLRNVYAAPFLQFLPPRFGAVLRSRMERCFALHPNRNNPYVRALMQGELPKQRPAWNPMPIEFVQADVVDFLQHQPAGSYDGFTLSNILDGASELFQQRLVQALERAAAPDAMLVMRSFREPSQASSANLAASDRSMLWGVVEALPLAASSLLRNAS
jgi:S-adenosylmethionine:diacylglycerol 3-amino-3-carboxypropyl transferase